MPDESNTQTLPVRPNGVPLVPNAGPRRPLAPSQHLTPSQKMAVNAMIAKETDPLKQRIAELETKIAELTAVGTPPAKADKKPASAPAAAKASAPPATGATPPAGKGDAKATPPAKPAAAKAAPPPQAPPAKPALPESNQEISAEAAAIIAKAKDPDLQRALTSIAKRDQPQEVTLAQLNAALQKYQPDAK